MKKRLPLIFLIVSSLILVLLVVFIDNVNVSFFDSWFYNEIVEKMSPNLTLFMRFTTESGSSMAVVILCLSFFLFKEARIRWAFPVSISVLTAAVSNFLLKLAFARERPNILRLIDEDYYSFPSGHAMINTSFYMMILLLTWRYIKNKRARWGISILCVMMPLIIGVSRIYLGVHYATDVAAGWLLGLIISIIMYKIFEKWNKLDTKNSN